MKKIKFLFLGLLTGLVLSVCAGCGQTAGDVKSTEDTDPVENAMQTSFLSPTMGKKNTPWLLLGKMKNSW